MNKTIQRTHLKETAQAIVDLIQKGIEAWHEAGKLIAARMDENPEFIELMAAEYPELSTEVLYRFEQIGRNQIVPSLLLNDSPGVRRLRKLPYQLQVKHSNEPITLTVRGGSTLLVDVRNLTSEQAAQVFAKDRIRTAAEQRAYIEDRMALEPASVERANLPYRIVGHELVVMKACKFTTAELLRLAADLQ